MFLVCPARKARKFRCIFQKRLLLGVGAAILIMESVVIQPALAADKVSLFKVITAKDEIVIGIAEDELAQMEGRNAGGIAKMLVAKGSMSVWQYAVHKSATGDLEQAPLHRIGLIAKDLLRVEPYATPLKVLPIDETEEMTGLSPGSRPQFAFASVRHLLPQGEKGKPPFRRIDPTRGPEYALLRAAGRLPQAPAAFSGRAP